MSERDTTADERLSEHARYLATVLAERVVDRDADPTSTDLETAAHLWLMGSYRQSTKLRPMEDVDFLVSLDEDGDEHTGEILRRVRNLYVHEDLVDNAPRASVRIQFHDNQVDVMPVFHDDEQADVMPVDRCSHATTVGGPHRDRFRQLVRLAKYLLASGTPATSCPAEHDEQSDRRPRQVVIELWLLLLAAEAPEGEILDRECSHSAWRVVDPHVRCTAQSDAVVLHVPQLTDEELARAWRVARERYQQTLDKVRLLERSSLGAARSRSARQRTSPRAVQEVFKRVSGGGTESRAPAG
ncbi:hypothetical protein [Kutzneria buriramensis]|uniref:Uncharacterized protein n=1 Tax=Kutzneria buriramensis TaxID=1045776 RepID=A0A3E0I9I1_9PSEU|nr:hypothetical protein [Kutzneria buriramensis]REH55216.1 hypothetical protein BCF44_101233 [Kutzneria buriramensis]